MRIRPVSVGVIAWVSIVGAALSLVGVLALPFWNLPGVHEAYLNSLPKPLWLYYGWTGLGLVISVACGFAMLRGKNWGRIGYVAWGVVELGYSLFSRSEHESMVWVLSVNLPILLLFAFFLFRPAANRFFTSEGAIESPASYGAIPLICFILATFLFLISFVSLSTNLITDLSSMGMALGSMLVMFLLPLLLASALLVGGLAANRFRNWVRTMAIVLGIGLLGVLPAVFISKGLPKGCPATPLTSQGRYDAALKKLQGATTDEDRFYALDDAAKEGYALGHYDEARQYALQLQEAATRFQKDWNYGNAIQDSNEVLGRLALREGRMEEAKADLLAAGRSPGSPVMNSFGPNMSLANDLLQKGEKDVVIQYLELCRVFWLKKCEFGKLDRWEADIRAGHQPDFGANLVY